MNGSDKDEFSNAGEVLRDLFDKIVPDETRRSAQVLNGWTDIVGSETSIHVVPVDIRNHALVLESDHPGWSQRIRMRQEGILRAVNAKYPELEIKTVKIGISEGKSPERKERISDGERMSVREPDSPVRIETKADRDSLDRKPAGQEDSDFFDLLEKMRRRGDP